MSRQQTSAPFGVPRGEGGVSHVPTLVDENSAASDIFDQFCTANTFQGIMGYFQQMCDLLGVRPEDHQIFYRKLKPRLVSWKAQSLWARLDRCATRREYKKGTACTNTRVLIIGAGPCGLRVAIEVAFLGGKAVIVEKRDRYSRNNVLHLWPYLIHDLKALGAKKFFGKFCASSIDHISIRTLQCILLKAALLVGVEIHPGVTFESILEPVAVGGDEGEETGWRVKVSPADHPVSEFEFDVLLGADGKRNTLAGFRRKEFRGKLAIAVTANFINHNTQQEARVEEISGVAFIFNQKFFRELNQKTNVDLENIVYYKDETHYFVMTAKKHSLLIKGVILQDYDDPERLLARSNVDQDALMAYAKEAAEVSTNHLLPDLEFAHNHYGQADVAMFDFTSMYHAEHASRVIERSGHKLLVALVGDSLLEPFWPMGTGCARGFLGAQDTAWMIRSWASGRQTPLEVMAERESVYQLLSQTTPENTCKNFSQYTIDPKTRYTNLNPHCVLPHQVKHQYDGGDLVYLNEIVQISEQNCKRYEWMRDQHYLLKWFQRQLEPYRSRIKVLDMTSSWHSGVALCALIHHYRPDLIDVYTLCPNKVTENNQLAFDLAEREFGIQPMMTGEDMAMCDSPDLVTMVSYLSQFYEHFRKQVKVIKDKKTQESLQARLARMSKINSRIRQRKDEDDKEDKENQQGEGVYKRPIFTYGTAKKRIKEMNDENNGEGGEDVHALDMEERRKRLGVRKDPTLRGLEAGMLGKNTVSVLAEDLAKKFRGEEPAAPEVKKLNPQPLTLGQAAPVDVCHFCGKKVYLVEKCMAEGVYFHRGCFRCHYCGTNLRLGAYTFQRGDGEEAMFFCFQHYGMTKPARRAKKRTYADNGGQVPTTPSPVAVRPDVLDGVGSTPERIEFDIESEQEESELEQTAHNLSGSIFGDESDSDSDESSDDEQHWSDPEVSDGQMSWADLADTYRRQLRKSMRRRHSQQQQLGGATDSDDTATIGSSCESWVSESETEKESEADDLKDPPRRKKMRKQEVKPESKFTLDPLSHSFGVDTKPSPTSVEMMRNRMSFFSAVSEPVRIDAHSFLGLVPPAKAPSTSSGSREGETPEVQTGKVQGAVLTRLSGAVPPVAIVTSDDDESETEKVSLGARASEVVDSDTTPTEPSVTLAEQENSEVGEDFCQDDGTGDETGDEDEMEMKKCMERLLSEEMVDGGLDDACLESSDISDYDERRDLDDERHDLDDLVENNEGGLSDEMLETDLLVENADMIQGLSQIETVVVDNVSGKDVSGNLEQTDALVARNDGVIPALEHTDVLVSNLKDASSELERKDVLVANNATGGEGGEGHPKVTEGSLELDQTNTLVAINSDAMNMSQQLNQTDVLVAKNLESLEAPPKQETQDSPVESSVDSKGVSQLERTDALVVSNLESTEVSSLEQTNALVESNSEDTLGATNLSDLVACNMEQLSDDDSLLCPQVSEPVSEVTTETAKVSQQQKQPDALVTNILEITETPQKEEMPNAPVESKVDLKDVSPLERTAALIESKVSSTEVSPSERVDALAESTEVSSLEQTNALVASNLEDTLGATNLSELVADNVDQLSDDDSLLHPQTKHALVAEVPTSDDHGTLVCGESEDVLLSGKAEVVPDISKTKVVDSSTEKSPMVDQPTKDSPVVVDQAIEECPVVTETVDEATEMDDESVGTHTLSLLAAANADPLSDTGNLSDIVTLNAQQLMPDDSLLCDSEPGRKPVADVTRPEGDDAKSGADVQPVTDVTKSEVDDVEPEAGITEVKAGELKESVETIGGKEQKEHVQRKVEAVVEPSVKDEEVVCPVKGQGNVGDTADVEPSDKGIESGITKADAATVQNTVDTNTVESTELKTNVASETRQDADLTDDRQTDTTINAMVTDNLPDTMERSVDLSQLVTTNTGHLPADDSVFDLPVTSDETLATPTVNGSEHVTGDKRDASDKSSIEADAIKRIDSLLENLSQTELSEFGRDSLSGQSAEPSLVEVSITDDEQGSHVVVVNETFVNTSDRRRRKHMSSSSSSTTDAKSASSVPSDHCKHPDAEDSLSLDKMVAANAGSCNGSMDEMLKNNATPDSSLAKLDPISRVDALIGSNGSARKLGVVGATPRLTPDLRKASSTSGLTGSDDSFHTPSACPKDSVTATPSKMSNPKLQNLSNHISTSEPKLTQEKHRLDSCKSWSDSQSDTSDQRSLTSLRTTGSSNSSPLYSPNQALVDAKRKFFFDTPQPVRFDHRAMLKDVGKSERDMDRGITDTSTPVEGNTAHALNGSPDVFFTPATSMKPKGKVAGRPRGADIRRQVLMKAESSDGGASEKTDVAPVVMSKPPQTQPIDIVGSSRERERPSAARSLPEKSFSVDSPYTTAVSSTPPPRGKGSHKALKKQKSKDDEKENKKGKRRSFLSMFLPSKNTEKKEKGAGKERVMSPETPEKVGKSKGVDAREKARKEKSEGVSREGVRPAVVVRPQGRKEARRPLTLTKDEAENRRSIYDEFGPLMGDMFGEQWKEATRERLEMVAPPPAKAPHTALLAPKAALEEFDTESELGDDMVSVRSFQSQGLSEDECARLHKKQAKAALRKRREQEQQRLHVAQQIQRQLEEVEVKQREVEKRGVVIERVLRGDGPDTQRDETELMQMWFNIVHEKNLLVRYESELMVHARELELEDRHSRLEQQYRERMQMNDAEKTVEMREEDERLLQELLEVVEQRDALVAMLEEDRVKQRKQDEELREMMLLKGYELSPSIPEYKWQPPQSIFSSTSDTR